MELNGRQSDNCERFAKPFPPRSQVLGAQLYSQNSGWQAIFRKSAPHTTRAKGLQRSIEIIAQSCNLVTEIGRGVVEGPMCTTEDDLDMETVGKSPLVRAEASCSQHLEILSDRSVSLQTGFLKV